METLTLIISILSGAMQLLGYWVYNQDIYKGRIKANVSTWFLWMVGSGIITYSYIAVSGDMVKNILPITCSCACMVTFGVALNAALKRREFEWPDRWDIIIICIDLAIVAYWMTTGNKEVANVMFLIDIAISHIPLLRSTWRAPHEERSTPWFIWVGAYSLMALTVVLRFEKGIDLAYPIILVFLHGSVGCIAHFRKTAGTCG